jgi:hypothetical protein
MSPPEKPGKVLAEGRSRHPLGVLGAALLVEVAEEVAIEAEVLEEPRLDGGRRAHRERAVEPVEEGLLGQGDEIAGPVIQLLACPAEAIGGGREVAIAEAPQGRVEIPVALGRG